MSCSPATFPPPASLAAARYVFSVWRKASMAWTLAPAFGLRLSSAALAVLTLAVLGNALEEPKRQRTAAIQKLARLRRTGCFPKPPNTYVARPGTAKRTGNDFMPGCFL